MSALEVESPRAEPVRRDWIHPLLVHELREWAQRPALTALLGVWLALVVGSALFIYLVGNAAAQLDPEALAGVAPSSAGVVAALCVALAVFVAPGMTGAALSGEGVRGMMRLLHLTPVGVARAVWFKQLAAWWVTVVLLLVPMPIVGLSVVQGVPDQPVALVAVASIALTTSWLFCALGLFISASVRRRLNAVALTYLATIGISFALPLASTLNLVALLDVPWVRGSFLSSALNLLGWLGLSLSAPSAAVMTLGDMFGGNLQFAGPVTLRGAWSWMLLSVVYVPLGAVLVGLAARSLQREFEGR